MAERKKPQELADFFGAQIAASRKKFGEENTLIGTEEQRNVYGIPFQHLSQMWMFKSTVLPLGCLIGFAGKSKAYKSCMGFELMKIVVNAVGMAQLIEHENKLNMQYLHSVFGTGALKVDKASTVEHAQTLITDSIKAYKKGKCEFPFVMNLDSISGSDTKKTYEKIDKAGSSQRQIPEATLLWNTYFKKLSSDLAGTNLLFTSTNHLKDEVGGMGFVKTYTKQGGTAQDLHASYLFNMFNAGKIDTVDRQGELIKIKCEKCSTGQKDHILELPVIISWSEDAKGEPIQSTSWDWDAATAKLLASDKLPKDIASTIDISCESNRYTSKELGLSKVLDFELGAHVRNNPKIMDSYRKRLHILSFKDVTKKQTNKGTK